MRPSLAPPGVSGPPWRKFVRSRRNRVVGCRGDDDLEILPLVVEGTVGSTGEEFFKDLVSHLATAIGVPFAAISEFTGDGARVRTRALWPRGRIEENFEYDLDGTPL